MATPTTTLRLDPRLRSQIDRMAKRMRRTFSEVTHDLLDEALRLPAPSAAAASMCRPRWMQETGTSPTGPELKYAAKGGRCLVTRNVRDFVSIAQDALRRQAPHAGIVLCPASCRGNEIRRMADALAKVAARYPDGFGEYGILFL